MEDYIHDLLAMDIVQPSSLPAGVGFFFVEKKDKTVWPCIDYCGLNELTIKNWYPLPLISSAFEVTIVTKLDLHNAYHLVHICEGDDWKMAFNTPTGHYEYLVMPFGLNNAPAVFQALVNDVLRDMLNQFVFIYLDILIFSKNKNEHVHHVQTILQCLLENSLFVKANKCKFHAVLSPSWDSLWEWGACRWTLPKFLPSLPGPHRTPAKNCSNSWDSLTITAGSSMATAQWQPPSPH